MKNVSIYIFVMAILGGFAAIDGLAERFTPEQIQAYSAMRPWRKHHRSPTPTPTPAVSPTMTPTPAP